MSQETTQTEAPEMAQPYERKGQVSGGVVSAIVTLIAGVGVAVLVLIFVGALGGQTYNLVQSDINAINDTTIKGHVEASITSGFSALETTGDYLPIIVLAVVIALVLTLVLGFMAFGNLGGGQGSAL